MLTHIKALFFLSLGPSFVFVCKNVSSFALPKAIHNYFKGAVYEDKLVLLITVPNLLGDNDS